MQLNVRLGKGWNGTKLNNRYVLSENQTYYKGDL
jgi:hypothetical protein